MNKLIPDYLKEGDKVGVVSPAGKVSQEEISLAIEVLENWNLKVILCKNVLNQNFQYAGTDNERLSDFQLMLDDGNIKCIFCSRGGYGTIRIIDRLDFSKFVERPKWIVGFSDITILHTYLNSKLKIPSIHGPMPRNFSKFLNKKSLTCLKNTLFGIEYEYDITPNSLNRYGHIKNEVLGGNLNILHNVIGSPSDFEPAGKILFIEDIGEYLYNIDRMMWGLKRAGKLKYLAGLIVGQFTNTKDNSNPFGKTEYEIIREHVEEYNYPVCFGFPAGHGEPNYTLILGKSLELNIGVDSCKIKSL